jgi:hypothetical protein
MEDLSGDETAKEKDDKPEVDPHVKSLIQSVAFEIQKSFSQRNLRKVQYKNTENLNHMYAKEVFKKNSPSFYLELWVNNICVASFLAEQS